MNALKRSRYKNEKGTFLMKLLGPIALLLVVIGAINWGLVGLVNINLVAAIFGAASTLSKAVYVLVGLSGLYVAVTSLPKEFSK